MISIDSISDAENSRANLTKYFETIKEVGLQHFKSNNLIQLINHCESALNTVKTCLENRIIETDMAIKETSELLGTSSKLISSAVFQVFQEKIF